ncbi:TPA: hypothetical protein O7X85_002474 [Salmonella enterica]|nr:hypothetical protein [Salmonella enterica]
MMNKNYYSTISTVTLERFRVARYVAISPSPELLVIPYMTQWAQRSGLLDYPAYKAQKIGWDFPFVSKEQQERFGLRGYVSAYIIPEDFIPACDGAELAYIETDTYVTLTITDPHSDSFSKIPEAYQMLSEAAKTSRWENRLAFEKEYEVNGIHYMDVFYPVN